MGRLQSIALDSYGLHFYSLLLLSLAPSVARPEKVQSGCDSVKWSCSSENFENLLIDNGVCSESPQLQIVTSYISNQSAQQS